MLHFILLALKILGIILLVLLGIILLILITVLFVPIRYRLIGKRSGLEDEPAVIAKGRITFLLHLLNIHLDYPSNIYLKVRIGLFTIFRLPHKEKKNSDKTENSKTNKKTDEKKRAKKEKVENDDNSKTQIRDHENNKKSSEKFNDSLSKDESEVQNNQNLNPSLQEINENQIDMQVDLHDENAKESKISIFMRIRDLIQTITYTIQKIYAKIQDIIETIKNRKELTQEKIQNTKETIQFYSDLLKSEEFQNAFSLCKNELIRILCKILPGKLQVNLRLGFEDPATTGQILVIGGILYPIIGKNIHIIGDFENNIISGDFIIKGKIRLINLVKAGLKIFFDKNIRKLLKLLKRRS